MECGKFPGKRILDIGERCAGTDPPVVGVFDNAADFRDAIERDQGGEAGMALIYQHGHFGGSGDEAGFGVLGFNGKRFRDGGGSMPIVRKRGSGRDGGTGGELRWLGE